MSSATTTPEKDESLGHIALDLPKQGPDSIIQATDGASISNSETEEDHPYEPFSGVATYDGGRLVTIRAVLTGGVLSLLIACLDLYLRLKSGFRANATLFLAIFSFVIYKLLKILRVEVALYLRYSMANSSTQRAVVLEEFGKPVSIVNDRPIPDAIPGSVVVKVFAAPLPRYIQTFYDGTIPAPTLTPPFVPNPGALGRVHKVGSGATKINEGDLVYVSTAILGRDDPNTFIMTGHVKGPPGPNTDRLAEGDYRDGSFQQYQRAPLENVYPINERRIKELGIDPIKLVSLSALSVSAGAVFEAGDIKISDTVVIGPSGGIFGGNTVEVALAVGANVIALGRDAEKLGDLKRRLNSPRLTTLHPEVKGLMFTMTGPRAASKGRLTYPAAEHALKRGGRIVLSGGAFGPVEVPYISVVFKKLKVEGSWMCNRQSMERIIRMIEDGRIDLGPESGVQVKQFELDEVYDAIKHAEETTRWRNITVVAPNVYDG
ncbi:hypothetical protein NM208_g5064 [Fusarium decemcellulare]|uniref:Uncharacterized protein n=1 Tax=Fusarium decemcellulare TaxID=57161 RepID=A0ACC1SIC4_9HYPO|nr:hypothetical protein NM208_g5064 [Fusarium decemcellulare]